MDIIKDNTPGIHVPLLFDSNLKNSSIELGMALYEQILEFNGTYENLIIVCIGTDRSTGDSLGPLTGYQLNKRLYRKNGRKVVLFGTLDKPVHAKNIAFTKTSIYSNYNKPLIIAIDACLGRASHIGFLQVGKGSVHPGAGVSKQLSPIGDIFITGIVNFGGAMEFFILQNTRLYIVMKMANTISSAVCKALDMLY